jgi:glycosyltransferase involved in cell wall biosynthesis
MTDNPLDVPRSRPWLLLVTAVKKMLKPHRLVLCELRNKALLWPGAVKRRRFEDAEVSRLSAELAARPETKVAVIISTYKRPELLARAIRSALAQTIDNITVLVVDDGGGLPDLREFSADTRLFICSLSANMGFPAIAKNVGIRLSKSKYVAFLDDDNTWEPEHLETALGAFEESRSGAALGYVYTSVSRSLPDGRGIDVLSVEFDRRRLGYANFVDTNAMVIKRIPGLHWSRIRRSPGVLPREDWELAYRLSRKMKVQHVNVATVRYLINPGSYYTDWREVL